MTYDATLCRDHQLSDRSGDQRSGRDHHRGQSQQLQPVRLLAGRSAHQRAREQGMNMDICARFVHFQKYAIHSFSLMNPNPHSEKGAPI
jgi:hypothetical protein